MSGTLGGFANNMRRISLQITGNVERAVRQAAIAADQAIVVATPVDTGRARSNWLVSVNTPRTDTIPPYSPGTKGSTSGSNVQGALAQGRSAVSGYREGMTIYITNNLDYIGKLNSGWSAQAPAGYIERAVDAAVRSIAGVRILDG